MPHKKIKCFETANMPEHIYEEISDLFAGEDTTVHWVTKEDDDNKSYDWFIANGAKDGEKVLIERGTW